MNARVSISTWQVWGSPLSFWYCFRAFTEFSVISPTACRSVRYPFRNRYRLTAGQSSPRLYSRRDLVAFRTGVPNP